MSWKDKNNPPLRFCDCFTLSNLIAGTIGIGLFWLFIIAMYGLGELITGGN